VLRKRSLKASEMVELRSATGNSAKEKASEKVELN
jgi:hypothetical protein